MATREYVMAFLLWLTIGGAISSCALQAKKPLMEITPQTTVEAEAKAEVEAEVEAEVKAVDLAPEIETQSETKVDSEGDATVVGGGVDSIALWLAILAGPLSYPLMRYARKKMWNYEASTPTSGTSGPVITNFVYYPGPPNSGESGKFGGFPFGGVPEPDEDDGGADGDKRD